jgi:sugar lactone lactonase YvrE
MDMKTTVLVDTARFPECPRWHEGKLWCSDFFARRVMSVDLNGNVQMVAQLEDMPGGLGWTPQGSLLVVSAFARRLLRLEDSRLAFPNGMVITPDGQTLIFLDPGSDDDTNFSSTLSCGQRRIGLRHCRDL